MISDYIDATGVSKMTFKLFKERLGSHSQIPKHNLTLEEAFIELGGKTKTKKKDKEEAQ